MTMEFPGAEAQVVEWCHRCNASPGVGFVVLEIGKNEHISAAICAECLLKVAEEHDIEGYEEYAEIVKQLAENPGLAESEIDDGQNTLF